MQDSSVSIAALILTKDEGKHIARCIESLRGVCDEVFVIDCFSKDDTRQKAEILGAKVYEHPWKNYATQFNWGLKNCPITADWVWRIDADEYLDKGLGQAVRKAISECADDVNGIYVRKRIDFMGRPLMHGGWYPSYHLKVWRRGHGECENRWMDEHIRLFDGRAITVEEGDQVDANLNNLTWWMDKHNGYATREMADMLMMEYGLDASAQEVQPKFFGTEEQRKRWLKVKYIKAPLFLRPFINFTIRYVLKAGFLDGREGFVWHFLQGFSYRFLVDAKIFELKKRFGYDETRIKQYLVDTYLGGSETGGVIRRLLLGWLWSTTDTTLTDNRLYGGVEVRPRNARKERNILAGLFSNTDTTDLTDVFMAQALDLPFGRRPLVPCVPCVPWSKNKTQWLKEYPCYPCNPCSKNKTQWSVVAEGRRAYAAA